MDSSLTPVAVIGFIALAIVFGFLWLRDQQVKNELREQGVHASGHVTARQHDVQYETDENNFTTTTDTYYVSYQYTVGGATYTGRESVDANTYEILREGQPVGVVYMPMNPAQARLASSL